MTFGRSYKADVKIMLPYISRKHFSVSIQAISLFTLYILGHKTCQALLLSVSLPIIDRFSKIFQWHTVQTICNNVIIIYLTTW